MKFKFLPVSSDFITKEAALELISGYVEMIRLINPEVSEALGTDEKEMIVYFVITGGTENQILRTYHERRNNAPDEPVILIAHPGNNSLPASLEVLARLQQDGANGRIIYMHSPNDKDAYFKIVDTLYNFEVRRQLRHSRIGSIGMPSDWLVASTPDNELLEKIWGPKVIDITYEDFKNELMNVNVAALAEHKEQLISGALEIIEPSDTDIIKALSVYSTLKQIKYKYSLNALAIRCFDLVKDMQTTGCYALSQLTDEGIVSGCEGDLISTMGLLWVKKLTGQSGWMANPAQINEKENSLLLAHCTVPFKFAEDYRLRSHFESGMGVGIQGSVPNGPVTLLRIGGKSMDKLWIAEGYIRENVHEKNLCRTQVKIQLLNGHKVDEILNRPLGNHIIAIHGRFMDKLLSWWELFINVNIKAHR